MHMYSDSPSRGSIMTRTRTSISVSFLDWVIQLSHKLTLTRGISIRYIPAVVSVSAEPFYILLTVKLLSF